MPRKPVDDPLVPVTLRLPQSLRDQLNARATSIGASLSDVVRGHLNLDDAKPLGKPKPRALRPIQRSRVSAADPNLLREIGRMSGHLDQIGRTVAKGQWGNDSSGVTALLVQLCAIERNLESLAAISHRPAASDEAGQVAAHAH